MLALTGSFNSLDWAVVAGVLLVTTVLGWIAGRRGSIRDYFLGGRTLPWWAVSASIVATEISALTLVSVPFLVFQPGGNFTYLQIAIVGNVAARLLVAWLLVPAWFEREIYSPYDYVEARLGARARQVTSALFAFGSVLAQGARLYLTAVVLEVLLHDELAGLAAKTHLSSLAISILIIGAFAVLWTWIGGMASVVWTDLVLFFVFTAAAITALLCVVNQLDTGWARVLQVGVDAHKFDVLDFDRSPARAFTFWAALFAASFGGIGAYGMDQMMAQRVFCCGSVRDARKALVASSVSVLVTVLVAFLGVALFAWYERHPLEGDALLLYRENGDRILPLFVVEHAASPWKGLIVAGIFAAAISTLAGVLTALSQTGIANLYDPWSARRRRAAEGGARGTDAPPKERPAARAPSGPTSAAPAEEAHERRRVRAARVFVLLAGAVLCLGALAMKRIRGDFPSILDMGLAAAGLTQGALLASFFLAWLPRRPEGSGFLWSAPLSVAWVFALARHDAGAERVCWGFAIVCFVLWCLLRLRPAWRDPLARAGELRATGWLVAALALLPWANSVALVPVLRDRLAPPDWMLQPLAWPWYVPAGSTIAFVFGLLLARPVRGAHSTRAASSPAATPCNASRPASPSV
ncbi:MAG: hypothetical protein IPJ77_10435 [Planctomycetes bacterium]|nr:hypothetical protein [Planctomycetota bacterium]